MRTPDDAKMQILFVVSDDNEVARYQKLLIGENEQGYDFIRAESGESGLSILQRSTPDCVLLDSLLLDMDGLDFLSKMPADEYQTPIVVLLGEGFELVVLEALRRGAQEYLIKESITAESLRHAIHNAIDKALLLRHIEEMEQSRAEFLSTVSYEFRTPLTIIQEFVSMVRDGVTGPITPAQDGCLSAALQNCCRLKNVITDTVEPGWGDPQHRRLHRQKTDLAALLRDRSCGLLPRYQMKYQHLTLDVTGNIPAVLCDQDSMGEVLSDLIGYLHVLTPPGGRVTVRAFTSQATPECVTVEMENTEAGSSGESQGRTRGGICMGDSAESPLLGCVPLRLARIRDIVTRHGGDFAFQNVPGQGGRLALTMPVYTDAVGMVAFVEDGRVAARSAGVDLSVHLVTADLSDSPTRDDDGGLYADYLERVACCIRRTLRRRDDQTLLVESERMIIVIAEVGTLGSDALRRRLGESLADEFGAGSPIALGGGLIEIEDNISDWIAHVRHRTTSLPPPHLGRRILIIDSDDATLDLVFKTLESSGLNVRIALAGNGEKGLQCYESLKPHLVIIGISEIDPYGEVILREIRADAREHSTKLMITSDSSERFPEYRAIGADECLAKPVNLMTLVASTARLLGIEYTRTSVRAGEREHIPA